jgi:hypothetical protein
MAKIVELIYVDVTKGIGVEGSVVRAVGQYWTKEGRLLWEDDPCGPGQNEKDRQAEERVIRPWLARGPQHRTEPGEGPANG